MLQNYPRTRFELAITGYHPAILISLGYDLNLSATGDHENEATPRDNMQHVYQR